MLSPLLTPNDDQERCGLILDHIDYVEVSNVAAEPKEGFEMDPVEALELLSTGEVTGTWHTHPSSPPVLSGDDYECFLSWPGLVHVILGFDEKGEFAVSRYCVKDGVVVECD